MATARELGLRKGDKIRLATAIYDIRENPELKGMDMSIGARVEVLDVYESGFVRVRYLEDEISIGRNNGNSVGIVGRKAGHVSEIWGDYDGFIPPNWMQKSWKAFIEVAKKYYGTAEL